MHYFAACVIPASVNYDEADPHVERAMAPYYYDREGEGGLRWDWYVIGGRWTGVWAEYDPEKDPRNLETCPLCDGSGVRPGGLEQFGQEWFEWSGGCNGCRGTGSRVMHAPRWVKLDFDLIPVDRFLKMPDVFRRPHTVITPNGAAKKETWNGNGFDRLSDEEWETTLQTALAPFSGDQVIVVDYHD